MHTLLSLLKYVHSLLKKRRGNVVLGAFPFFFISRVLRTGLTDALNSECHLGGVCIDVGANIGYYSILMSKLVGPAGRVYSFEPDPLHYKKLEEGVRVNACENVILRNCAISDSPKRMRLYLSQQNSSDHTSYFLEGRESISITATSLDQFCRANKLTDISIVKIDVQGHECSVLQGMRAVLTENQAIKLFIEFWPEGIKRAGSDPEALLDTLEELQLEFYLVRERVGAKRITREELSLLVEKEREIDLMLKRRAT